MKEYFECVVCEKLLAKKEVIVLNGGDYYCKKCWKGYLGISKIAELTGSEAKGK